VLEQVGDTCLAPKPVDDRVLGSGMGPTYASDARLTLGGGEDRADDLSEPSTPGQPPSLERVMTIVARSDGSHHCKDHVGLLLGGRTSRRRGSALALRASVVEGPRWWLAPIMGWIE